MIKDVEKRENYLRELKRNVLLKDLPETKFDQLFDVLEEEVWPRHTCSLSKPQCWKRFHFILSGRLKIYRIDEKTGREFTIFLLNSGHVFDLLCLLDSQRHDVFYETLEKVMLLYMPLEEMRRWIKENPEINKNMLPYLSQRMRILEEQALSLTFADISTRLAQLILRNINSESNKLELINDLSNEEIANLIGSTRAVVNRHLQMFKDQGILEIGRHKVELRNLELLLQKIKH